MSSPVEQRLTGKSGCMIALLIGFATVGGVSLLSGANLNLRQEWGVLLFSALVVAAPFGVLATARESGRVAWLAAAALTGMFWGLVIGDVLIRRGGGANIGFGWLMLLSPLIITGGAFAASAVAKLRR